MFKEWMSILWPESVDGGSKWRAGTRETEVGLVGWCEGATTEYQGADVKYMG